MLDVPDKMKSIGIIDQVGSKAGMDLYSYSLLNSFRTKGFDVFLFSNVRTTQATVHTEDCFTKSGSSYLAKGYSLLRGYILSFCKARRRRIDYMILHVFSYSIVDLFAFFVSWLLQFKTVAIVHDVETFESGKGRSDLIRYLIFNYLADSLVIHNTYSYQEILKSVDRSRAYRIRIIRHGAYTDLPADIITTVTTIPSEIDPSRRFILFFGQIRAEKGLDVLLSAMPLVDNSCVLVIAGRLREKSDDRYRRIALQHNVVDRCVFIERYVTEEEKNYLFKSAAVVAIPYKQVFQSGVLLTAMSYGKITVVSDLRPNMDIVKDGVNGFSFMSENSADLANKINRAISLDTSAKIQMEREAYSVAHNDYSWDSIASIYVDLFSIL